MAAFYLMSSSKKGISAHQLHRTLEITYKSAWFLAHRVREAMRAGGLVPPAPLGGEGGTVEIDETYHGKIANPVSHSGKPGKMGSGPANKRAIISLVERGGSVRSFHVAYADKVTVNKIINENVSRETVIYTDESKLYGDVKVTWEHDTVKHSVGEYVRGTVHTNTIEGVFSIFKRGMRGVYQHCAEKHLHRYLAEYDFRYNHRVKLGFSDMERTLSAVKGAEGKRLTYRQPHSA
jgi:transposase-like protein